MDLWSQFQESLKATTPLEYIAAIAGIISVWFSKKENILVYPVGLVNTIAYTYLSAQYALFGEGAVNFYYTVMSIYGWYLWGKKDQKQRPVLHITSSNRKDWMQQLGFFLFFYAALFTALTLARQHFFANTVPGLDAFASAAAFTGMWLMARKKLESWYWWIITNITAIPLYFQKGLVVTSIYYFILLLLALSGLHEWKQKIRHERN